MENSFDLLGFVSLFRGDGFINTRERFPERVLQKFLGQVDTARQTLARKGLRFLAPTALCKRRIADDRFARSAGSTPH